MDLYDCWHMVHFWGHRLPSSNLTSKSWPVAVVQDQYTNAGAVNRASSTTRKEREREREGDGHRQ